MLLLGKQDMERIFTMEDAIEADKEAYALFAKGSSDVPLRTQIRGAHDGTFLFMPAYAKEMDCASVKIVNIFPHNKERNLPTATGQILVMDGKTGIVEAILDGTYVTQVRTGAASGAAFSLLAKKECRKGAVIGTGSQAFHQVEGMITARDLEEVWIYSRNEANVKALISSLEETFGNRPIQFVMAPSSDAAIEDADVIIAVTSATAPVLDGTKVTAGATVSCIGSYQPQMQEVGPELLTRASKIYCDSVDAVLAEAGDFIIPIEDGTLQREDITGNIGDVILGNLPGREHDDEIIVFKSVGIGTQDLVTAKAIYDMAKAAKVGTLWHE